jgi:hypothetical protein
MPHQAALVVRVRLLNPRMMFARSARLAIRPAPRRRGVASLLSRPDDFRFVAE